MKKFAVIGLGRFGFYMAKALFEEGHEVVAIDMVKSKVQAIDAYSYEAVLMDARDMEKLKTLGLEEMDSVIVSTGERISNSIMITLHLSELGVEHILAKANDEDHEKILKRVGATKVIHPEKDMAIKLASGLSQPNVLDFIPLEEDFNLIQLEAPEKFVGKTLRELDLRAEYEINVIAIKEQPADNFILSPSPDFRIKDGDILVMLGKAEDIQNIEKVK